MRRFVTSYLPSQKFGSTTGFATPMPNSPPETSTISGGADASGTSLMVYCCPPEGLTRR